MGSVFSFCSRTVDLDFKDIWLISWNTLKHKLDVYQNLFQLLLLALVRFLPPSLPGILEENTHHQDSPWMKRLGINQLTPDLRSKRVISLLLFPQPLSLSTDKSPHRKSDNLFQFINDAHPSCLFHPHQPTGLKQTGFDLSSTDIRIKRGDPVNVVCSVSFFFSTYLKHILHLINEMWFLFHFNKTLLPLN